MRHLLALVVVLALGCPALAQIGAEATGSNGPPQVFGIYIDSSGTLGHRQADANKALGRLRSARSTKEGQLAYVSLAKVFSAAREAIESHQTVPEEARYLQGLTQIRYIFIYPEEKDLVFAGPAESIDDSNPLLPLGKLTGRPVIQLDDLVVALRAAQEQRGRPFGCSIDPAPHALEKGQQVARDYANAPRAELIAALAKALGPQPIRIFGVADNTRFGFACVAADYQLKRYFLGLDAPPVPGLGNPTDSTRAAGNAYWFEAMYEPLLVSEDGNSYEIRGQRLGIKTGHIPFDAQGATPRAQAWAKTFTQKTPQIQRAMPLFADLANLADLSLAAQLIRADHLAEKAKLDLGWVMDSSRYTVATIPTPRQTDTLVNITNGSVTAGGVTISTAPLIKERKIDRDRTLAPIREARGR